MYDYIDIRRSSSKCNQICKSSSEQLNWWKWCHSKTILYSWIVFHNESVKNVLTLYFVHLSSLRKFLEEIKHVSILVQIDQGTPLKRYEWLPYVTTKKFKSSTQFYIKWMQGYLYMMNDECIFLQLHWNWRLVIDSFFLW